MSVALGGSDVIPSRLGLPWLTPVLICSAWRLIVVKGVVLETPAQLTPALLRSAWGQTVVKELMADAHEGSCFIDSCYLYLQRMEPSNVSGGYWQQLPAAMQKRWRFGKRTEVELECEDDSRKHSALKKEAGIASWQYQVPSLTRTPARGFLEKRRTQ